MSERLSSSARIRTLHGKPDPWFARIMQRVNAAIARYAMISSGDDVLVGLSGGKDSIALLVLLAARLKTAQTHALPRSTEDGRTPRLRACYIENPAYPMSSSALAAMRSLCEEACIPFSVRPTPIDIGQGCYFCAHARRKALIEEAAAHGGRIVALGHTRTDIAQTALLNLAQHGNLEGLAPVRRYFNDRFVVIRPLVFLDETDIRRVCARLSLPVQPSPCPLAGTTKRAHSAAALDALRHIHPHALANIAHAAQNCLNLHDTQKE